MPTIAGQATYDLVSPSGGRTVISVVPEDGEFVLQLPQFQEPGFYELANQDDAEDRSLIAANVDTAEGAIRAMTPEELEAAYGKHGVRVRAEGRKGGFADAGAIELSALLLLLMALCWLGENLLACRISTR